MMPPVLPAIKKCLAEETTRYYRAKHDARHYPERQKLAADDLIDDQAREDESFNVGIRVAAHHLAQLGQPKLVVDSVLSLMRYIP